MTDTDDLWPLWHEEESGYMQRLRSRIEQQAAQLRELRERIKNMESNRDYWRGECIQSEQRVDALHRELKQRPIFMPTEEHFKRKLAKRDERIAELESRPCPYVISTREGTHYCSLADKAERELAEARRDAEMLDWLDDNIIDGGFYADSDNRGVSLRLDRSLTTTVREAIAEAMGKNDASE